MLHFDPCIHHVKIKSGCLAFPPFQILLFLCVENLKLFFSSYFEMFNRLFQTIEALLCYTALEYLVRSSILYPTSHPLSVFPPPHHSASSDLYSAFYFYVINFSGFYKGLRSHRIYLPVSGLFGLMSPSFTPVATYNGPPIPSPSSAPHLVTSPNRWPTRQDTSILSTSTASAKTSLSSCRPEPMLLSSVRYHKGERAAVGSVPLCL